MSTAMATTPSLSLQLITLSILSLQRQLYHNRGTNRTTWNASYDFVVIGGGTAGCIVAGRLSENPNVNVLLLEAGGPITITSDMVPTFYWFSPSWGNPIYYTVPQRTSGRGFNNRQVPYPRGRILGGSHSLNMAAYTRGNYHDYDNWANHYGATGWSFNEIFPYFLRSENNTDPDVVARSPGVHSTTGPIEVSTIPNPDPFISRWLSAVNQLGWPLSDFADSRHQYGATLLQATSSRQNWTRQSTAAGFIEVNIARPNLHVLINSQVTRILMDSATSGRQPRATGVEFIRNNQTSVRYQVNATREMILSAGSTNSPQILMLSGIGPQAELSQHGITTVADLPVGQNLADHFLILMDFTLTNASDVGWSANLYYNLNVQNLYDYFARSTGPLTRMPLTETYLATGVNGDTDWPDGVVYLLFFQISPNVDAALPLFDQNNRNAWATYWRQYENNNRQVALSFSVFRPLSTGSIRLASADPFASPLIDPAYFSNRQDLVAITRAMSMGIAITESSLLSPYMKYSSVPLPGCQFCTDGRPLSRCYSYLACVAQTFTLTSFHPVGSCRMGNGSSTDAVVDERLRVRGVSGLRVIDGSIMPTITNANPNAPIMMIAEKGADLVRQDNGLPMGG